MVIPYCYPFLNEQLFLIPFVELNKKRFACGDELQNIIANNNDRYASARLLFISMQLNDDHPTGRLIFTCYAPEKNGLAQFSGRKFICDQIIIKAATLDVTLLI